MNLATLKEELTAFQQANQGDIVFPVPPDAPARYDLPDSVTALFSLFSPALGGTALTLGEAAISGDDQSVVVTGKALLWESDVSGITATFTADGDTLQLALAVPLPSSWKFSTSFSKTGGSMLDYLTYGQAPTFVFASFPHADGKNSGVSYQTGLNFLAPITFPSLPLSLIKTLSGTSAATIYGTVAIDEKSPEEPATAFQSVETFTLQANNLLSAIVPTTIALEKTTLVFDGAYSADLDRYMVAVNFKEGTWQSHNPDLSFPASMDFSSNLTFSSNLGKDGISSAFDALAKLAGGDMAVDGLQAIESFPFSLTYLEVEIYPATTSLVRFAATVSQDQHPLTIIPNLMAIQGMVFNYQIADPFEKTRSQYFSFSGTFLFSTVEVDLSGQYSAFSGFQVQGSLPQSHTMDFDDLGNYLAQEPVLAPLAAPIKALPTLTFSDVAFSILPAAYQFTINATITNQSKPWEIIPAFHLALDKVLLDLTVSKQPTSNIAGTIQGIFHISGTMIDITLVLPFKTLELSGKQTGDPINVGSLIEGIGTTIGIPGVTVPTFLHDLDLSGLALDYKTTGDLLTFSGVCQLTLADQSFQLALNIALSDGKGTYGGILLVGQYQFALTVDTTDDTTLTASWKTSDKADYLTFEAIADAFGFPPPEIPSDLDLALENVTFKYDFTNHSLVIEGQSANYGKAVFAALKEGSTGTWRFFFGLGAPNINLSNLPLIDRVLSGKETLEIKEIQVLIASAAMDPSKPDEKQEITDFNNLIGLDSGYPTIPSQGMPNQVALSAQFDFGGYVIPLSIGAGGSSPSVSAPPALSAPRRPAAFTASQPALPTAVGAPTGSGGDAIPQPSKAADGATWFDIQKNFGPVHFQKVGVAYKGGVLWFLIDAALEAAGLEISVEGLSVGSSLSDFDPQFNIQGLGVDYRNGVVAIEGAFEKMPPKAPVTLEFAGSAAIKLESVGISAIGSYAQFNGQTSLFVFAAVNGDFGGPGFFFVTGFCGGFGYNSKLRIPDQDQVFQFPFVAATSNPAVLGNNPTPTQVLENIMGGDDPWVTPSAGDIWLSGGIMFTTYEVINSTALLTAEFGNKFLLALIGLSRARFPMEGNQTYAYVELQLESIFDPSDGLISFTAVLSPNSYLLDPACHLTGGFAMVFWYGPNPHAGDFVVTLGGYSPYFNVPAYYPKEPRLGFNWAVSSSVTISGGVYFALTPSAVMAGGELDARYHDGNLKAWFTAHADIIIWYNPFHFIADIGVNVGASYKVDLLFCSKTFSVELGADLTLWGPATGGTATIHWWVISFTVDFGADRTPQLEKQDWSQFSKVLPAGGSAVKINPVSGLAPLPATAKEADGGQQDAADAAPAIWTVRSHNFRFTTQAVNPVTQLYLGDDTTPYKTGDPLNIKPMELTGLTSKQTVTIIDEESGQNVLGDNWTVTHQSGNLPSALWGTGKNTVLSSGSQLVGDQLTGFVIQVPDPTLGQGTGDISIADDLQYDPLTPGTNPLQLGLAPQGPAPQAGDATVADIENIAQDPAKSGRNALFGALTALGAQGLENDDLTNLGKNAGTLYADEPLLVNPPESRPDLSKFFHINLW